MKISVLLSVRNGKRYLPYAIQSILNQTFTDFEFLIVDDGSTDGTADVLRRYESIDRRITVIRRGGRGLVPSLNELLYRSKGEYCARMDADDIALPHRFARQHQYLSEHPRTVCLGTAFEVIDSRERKLTVINPPCDNDTIQNRLMAGHGAICHPSAMMRRDALIAIGGYAADTYPAEDLDLWLRLGEFGQLANLECIALKYRIHDQSVSEQLGYQQRQAAFEVCRRASLRRGCAVQFEAFEPWRPGADTQSRRDFFLDYGWRAWNCGEFKTAAIYSLKSLSMGLHQRNAWILLCRALAGMGRTR